MVENAQLRFGRDALNFAFACCCENFFGCDRKNFLRKRDIKYKKKKSHGYRSSNGIRTCFYKDELENVIIDKGFDNIFEDGVINVWYRETPQLENTYKTECEEFTAPTMYEITFLNNYGQVVTYEGTFTEEEKQSTDVNNRESDDNVIIYPNPSSGLFKVRSIKNDFDRITIYDILGNAVKNINIQGKRNFDLDLSDYPTGCYYISISGNDSYIVKQIIKK